MATPRRVLLFVCFVLTSYKTIGALDQDVGGGFAKQSAFKYSEDKLANPNPPSRLSGGVGTGGKPPFSFQGGALSANIGGGALPLQKVAQPQGYNEKIDNRINPNVEDSMNRGPQGGFANKRPALPSRPPAMKLADSPACAADVKQYCSHSTSTNNFAILDCLQNDIKSVRDISETCQHFVWQYKLNLTRDLRFDSAANEVCKDSLNQLTECNNLQSGSGHRIACLIEHKENITKPGCRNFLTKMASIVFSDYRLITNFAESCQDDISRTGCGRAHPEKDDSPHSQGATIECLEKDVGNLNAKCKHEILRVAELQADDYHEDRQLFYACRDDRERLCARTKAGGGKVYRCLFRHKFDKEMSSDCRDRLTTRQKLMQANYKVNYALTEACRADVKRYHCFKNQEIETRNGKLSTILLCLEDKLKQEKKVSPECITELKEMRRSLMEDYLISPEIVQACEREIKEQCDGMERNGKTLHCLMDAARNTRNRQEADGMQPKCLRQLEALVKEADVGDDFSVDPFLAEACAPVVKTACKDIKPGEGRIMNCLMELIDSDAITDDCQEKLLELQYFVARDFKLDSRLYKLCKHDAAEKCMAATDWFNPDDTTPEQGPIVFTCLYRHTKDKQAPLSRACAFEVKRVMRQRAISIELEPRIETPCLQDLAMYCSEETGPGKEMACLQGKYERLSQDCKIAVGNFTEDEDEDPQLDKILMRSCTPMIKKFCGLVLHSEDVDAGGVMECLIEYKNHASMNRKCAEGIEHHQLVNLKDFRFSYKFKEECKSDIQRLCRGMRTKTEVIKCLSEVKRNDTLMDNPQRLSRACQRQLRVELLQRSETINLDPDLKQKCSVDIQEHCPNITPGRAQVVECLKKKETELTDPCKKLLFKREQVEAIDSGVDYRMMTNCKTMIQIHCRNENPEAIVQCLHRVKDTADFSSECKKVLTQKQILQSKDIRLNPILFKSCKLDIPKFCKAALTSQAEGKEFEGVVIVCLKIQFRKHKLSHNCEVHIGEVIKDAALDYRQDPKLAQACNNEIRKFCLETLAATIEEDNNEGVEECLKTKLIEGKIDNQVCMKEVTRILAESRADIQVDPLLHKACAHDLKHYCADIPLGEGRHMSCLLSAKDDRTVHLTKVCSKMLNDRVSMWEYAAKVAPPEDIGEFVETIMQSRSRNYFLVVIFTLLGLIFFGGIFCGRVTKKVRALQKNNSSPKKLVDSSPKYGSFVTENWSTSHPKMDDSSPEN